ncbi:Protein SMALL AUXIN UP-REGULATED RNA 9 [Cardamine amara subsp. amara]|uniref:Protein SMALL AUXIN UP-REGULATED RNA 9 n=1 Tax=Cardamine amara subsp. amara TaxID=228776 RepID=A0ABD0ZZF0_CARAN
MEINQASKTHGEIRRAVSLKQILKRCSSFVKKSNDDVPKKGHFAVYVGHSRARHVIPITFLNHPTFKMMLQEAEEEFGFSQERGLTIPCDQTTFLSLLDSIISH